jgi:adenine-specific DNA-methyltransferase
MIKKTDQESGEQKIREALEIIEALGLPRQQQNERSALTLLSLLDLKPADRWQDAENPLIGITPMMEFFKENYGKRYAPNTRETVRRQTVHQFMQAALIVPNPDKPSRPTNSPKAVYQIEPSALKLLRGYGKRGWKKRLREYLHTVEPLNKLYARERDMERIPPWRTGRRSGFRPGDTMPWSRRFLPNSARFSLLTAVSYTSAILGKSGPTLMPPSCKSWALRSKNTARCPMLWCIMWQRTGWS